MFEWGLTIFPDRVALSTDVPGQREAMKYGTVKVNGSVKPHWVPVLLLLSFGCRVAVF